MTSKILFLLLILQSAALKPIRILELMATSSPNSFYTMQNPEFYTSKDYKNELKTDASAVREALAAMVKNLKLHASPSIRATFAKESKEWETAEGTRRSGYRNHGFAYVLSTENLDRALFLYAKSIDTVFSTWNNMEFYQKATRGSKTNIKLVLELVKKTFARQLLQKSEFTEKETKLGYATKLTTTMTTTTRSPVAEQEKEEEDEEMGVQRLRFLSDDLDDETTLTSLPITPTSVPSPTLTLPLSSAAPASQTVHSTLSNTPSTTTATQMTSSTTAIPINSTAVYMTMPIQRDSIMVLVKPRVPIRGIAYSLNTVKAISDLAFIRRYLKAVKKYLGVRSLAEDLSELGLDVTISEREALKRLIRRNYGYMKVTLTDLDMERVFFLFGELFDLFYANFKEDMEHGETKMIGFVKTRDLLAESHRRQIQANITFDEKW